MSAAHFQTPSATLHVRTTTCQKEGKEDSTQDGPPTIRAYAPKTQAALSPPAAPAMIRESSGGHPLGRRGTNGRKQSPANHGPESFVNINCEDGQKSSDDEIMGNLAQLSGRFQRVQQDNENIENQILEEEEEHDSALREMEVRRDELKQQVKERDEQSGDLRRQVHKLESESRAKQSEKSKKERQLQQKEHQHRKRRDEVVMWDEQISSMKEEISLIEKQQVAMKKRTTSELRDIRQKIEDEQKEVRLLDEENKEKAMQTKALEEDRARLNEHEETEESREADRLERERDYQWEEKMHNFNATYAGLTHSLATARQQHEIARERLAWIESVRQSNMVNVVPPLGSPDTDDVRRGTRPWRTRQRGSLASSVSSPTGTFPGSDMFQPSGMFQQTSNASPTFSGPKFFSYGNGMSFKPSTEETVTTPNETEALTGGAPMSPRADALIPSNLLGDESADDEPEGTANMDDEFIGQDMKTASVQDVGSPRALYDAPGSPSPMSSASRSFSSPRESVNNTFEGDGASLSSRKLFVDQQEASDNPQSASRKLTGLFSFNRQRGKTLADEPPMLGSLKQGQSQSFPRNLGDSLDPLALQRRRRGYSGTNWAFPASLLPRSSITATGTKDRASTTRRALLSFGRSPAPPGAFDPFAGEEGMDTTGSSKPSSLYSFEGRPRPSAEDTFRAWGPQFDRTAMRGSPLVPDWNNSQISWSRSQSRRPSVQYGSSSNLSLSHPENDFLDPPREPQRPLQAPIGTRPTSSQHAATPKLNPAAPAFTTQFFARKAEKNKEKEKAKLRGGLDKTTTDPDPENASPPDSRKSKDTQSVATTGSLAESRESLDRTMSGQSGGTPSEMTPAKENFIHKLITRKSSSSKFNSWKDKGGLFSRKGESSTPGEIEEGDVEGEAQLGKSVESVTSTPTGEKEERPKGSRSSMSFSFMKRSKKKEDLAASEVSESSERASEAGNDDIAEEGEEDAIRAM